MTKILGALLLFFTLGSTPSYALGSEHHYTIKSGDTLSKYFRQLGLSHSLLSKLINANKDNKKLNKLSIGNKLIIRLDDEQNFASLSYQLSKNKTLNVRLDTKKPSASAGSAWNQQGLRVNKIIIKRSLYADGKSKVDKTILDQVIKALAWDLDFGSELHKGDTFYIVSRQQQLEAVIFIGKVGRFEAFAYQNKYYNRYGNSLTKSFLRAPVKYKRISSGFQLRRFHPILKTYRPHRAVDYAADYGTRVVASADGVISFKGRKGPLGKTIMINHGNDYVTVYAHLSNYARGMKKSKRVKKGQLIGYVGSTGRSTGNHLHYEIRHKGDRKNPLTYKLPKGSKISKNQLWNFRTKVNGILSSLR